MSDSDIPGRADYPALIALKLRPNVPGAVQHTHNRDSIA
jgi:hypothetical protein